MKNWQNKDQAIIVAVDRSKSMKEYLEFVKEGMLEELMQVIQPQSDELPFRLDLITFTSEAREEITF